MVGLFATAEAAQTTLTWDRSQDPDVTGYRVHYGTTTKKYDKTVDVGNNTTTTVSNLTADTSYYFVVTAYNSLKLESLPSSEVAKSTAVQKLQVVLSWDRSADSSVTGYRVQYGTSSGKYDKKLDVGNTTTATVADLAAESSYYFVVSAYTAAQLESLPSNEVTVPSRSQTSALAQTSSDTSATLSGTNTTTLASTTSDPTRVALKAAVPGGTTTSSTTDAAADTAASTDGATTDAAVSAVAGKYIGVIISSTPSSENAGEVTLNTTSAGKFTGTLTLGGKRHALKGVFDTAGAASVSVPRAGSAPLTVKLQASAGRSAGELSGTVSDGTTTSEIVGDRAAAKNAASTLAGKWTVLFSTPEAVPADNQAPEGTGYASIQVNRNGSARISGTLADGTVFARGTAVSKNNYLYVYVPLYKNRGVLAGALELKSDANTGGTLSGSVQWVKPAGVAGKASNAEGFQLDLQATGESYRKQAASQPGAGFPSTNGVSTITLSGGDLAAPLSHALSISAAGKVSVTDPGADRLKVTLNVAAGTFSGSFLDVGANKSRRFSGAVLQTQAVGAGAFQGGTKSGSVTLLPKK